VNTDFRIEVGFFDHRKTRALITSLGIPAAFSLMRLWEYATANKPSGELRGMSHEDIADAAKYQGDPIAFVNELIRLKWLDKRRRHLDIHDWEEHQPFVINAPARRAAAKKAAETRWKSRQAPDADRNAPRMRHASNNDADRNAPSGQPASQPERTPLPPANPSRSPDLPSPIPSGGSRTRTDFRKLGDAYREPAGARPKLSPAEEERMTRYGVRRRELIAEMQSKHPAASEAEILAFVSAQLKVEGLTA